MVLLTVPGMFTLLSWLLSIQANSLPPGTVNPALAQPCMFQWYTLCDIS